MPMKHLLTPMRIFFICMFFTGGLKQEAENSIQTLKNNGLSDNLVVTVLYDEAYFYMEDLGIEVEKCKTRPETRPS